MRPMKQLRSVRRSLPISAARISAASILAALLVWGCAWEPWIPGERDWNPDIVVKPGDLSKQLPLGVPYVDELDCYSSRCEKRFRLVVEQPGQLTVIAIPELSNQDSQARLVLESLQGVLGRAATPRGPRDDVVTLAVSDAVDPGMYFVLIQSVGGALPYQLTAHLTPGDGAPPKEVAAVPVPPAPAPTAPPPRLVAAPVSDGVRAGYDPAVPFSQLRTFSFRNPDGRDDTAAAGTTREQPVDREIRRSINDDLTLRGFEQAYGGRPADLTVDFSRRTRNRSVWGLGSIYDRYDFGSLGWGRGGVDTRATLTVDLIDNRDGRIAWHAQTTKAMGPGIVASGEASTELVREAVTELLAGFPPR